MAAQIYIVEDYERLRGMIEELVQGTEGLAVCGSSGTAEEALERLPGAHADLVLIDVSLPGISGLDLLTELRRSHSSLRCVMLSGHRSMGYLTQAREGGAQAYLLKSAMDDLTQVLWKVLSGGSDFESLAE